MAFKVPCQDPKERLQRPLGVHETQIWNCQQKTKGAMNILAGLTLVTRHQIDEGLMKCALQEFQHMFPFLTTRLRNKPPVPPNHEESVLFVPMECPILPLDTSFECRDMLHDPFKEETGPLWRVQLITESSMEASQIGFGPELAAIIEDDSDLSTRWRYFLRYMQGKVNQRNIEPFDSTEEGFRSFILFAFHPCITDTIGVFHMLRQFLVILDSILVQDGNTAPHPDVGVADQSLPPSIETLIPQSNSLKSWIPSITPLMDLINPRFNALEFLGGYPKATEATTEMEKSAILRGWLSETQTEELLAFMEESDITLHGVLLAASIISLTRMLEAEKLNCPTVRVNNEINMRQLCTSSAPKVGSLSSFYESDYPTQDIDSRSDFWKFAHTLTSKHNSAKDHNSQKAHKLNTTRYHCDMTVTVFGNLNKIIRIKTLPEMSTTDSIDTWSKPLNEVLQTNIRLEDVFHVVNGSGLGVPFQHSAHILHGKLNYFLTYNTELVKDQRYALMVRDETVNVLRMAVDAMQD